MTWLDDHSRRALSLTAHHRVTGPLVLAAFRAAAARYGPPAPALTDNAMVLTARLPGGRDGRNGLETDLRRLGITPKNGRPSHPRPTAKPNGSRRPRRNRWPASSPRPPGPPCSTSGTPPPAFTAPPGRTVPGPTAPPPQSATAARPKATPGNHTTGTHHRDRRDRIDHSGVVTLRHHGKPHHTGTGRTHTRTHILLLTHDQHIRVINAATGQTPPRTHPQPRQGPPAHRTPPRTPTPNTNHRKHKDPEP